MTTDLHVIPNGWTLAQREAALEALLSIARARNPGCACRIVEATHNASPAAGQVGGSFALPQDPDTILDRSSLAA